MRNNVKAATGAKKNGVYISEDIADITFVCEVKKGWLKAWTFTNVRFLKFVGTV